MKISCSIAQDLLPLYADGVCGEESKKDIEEHLSGCPECSALLEKMKEEQSSGASKIDDAAPIKAIQAKWKKGKLISFLKGCVIALIVSAVIYGGNYGLTRWKCIPVSAKLLEVGDVVRLSDGRIAYRLSAKDGKSLSEYEFTELSDGSEYKTFVRSVISKKEDSSHWLLGDWKILDLAEENDYRESNGSPALTAYYVGPVGNGTLVWKEGMELPAADSKLEENMKIYDLACGNEEMEREKLIELYGEPDETISGIIEDKYYFDGGITVTVNYSVRMDDSGNYKNYTNGTSVKRP